MNFLYLVQYLSSQYFYLNYFSSGGDASQECTQTEFQCKNKQECIPGSYRCDGKIDCEDDSDEQDCQCPDWAFKCKSKLSKTHQCLQKADLCDGIWDCHDGSDELNCKFLFFINDLLEYKFKLGCYVGLCLYKFCLKSESNLTILMSFFSGGFEPCEDHHYHCRGENSCILRSEICDGFEDCKLHKDDEENCRGKNWR